MAFTSLVLGALSNSACGGEDPEPIPEPKAWGCVEVLDQNDRSRTDCTFKYKLSREGKDFKESDAGMNCNEGELFVYGSPGHNAVQTECDRLHGHVEADLYEGENEIQASHLINSLCYNNETPIVMDPLHKVVNLGDLLGFHSANRCTDWFDYKDIAQCEVVGMSLDCDGEDACEPVDGRDYLKVKGARGEYSNAEALHMILEAQTQRIPEGEKVIVKVSVRMIDAPRQEIEIPIVIQGAQAL